MFTIEVKKKGKDEEFSFKDLEMCHQECGGGKIEKKSEEEPEWPYSPSKWILICQRCGGSIEVKVTPNFQTTEIIATAIDGRETEFFYNVSPNVNIHVRVVQRT